MTRTSILGAVLFCASASAAGAQGLGITAGFSYGQVPNNGGALPGTLSAHSGAALGIRATGDGPVSLGVEGMYAERGYNSSAPGNSQKLSYIDVPVYVRLSMPNPGITPFAYAGPQASFEMHCDGGGGECPSGRKHLTYSGIIGAGLRFGALGNVSLEGRYVYGLTDLNFSTVSSGGSYKTRSFMLLAGLGF